MKTQQEARNTQGRRISQTAEMCFLDSLPGEGMLRFSYCETTCNNVTSLDNRMFCSSQYGGSQTPYTCSRGAMQQ